MNEEIYIVNSELCIVGGLEYGNKPDSAFIDLKLCERRINDLYNESKQYCQENNIELDNDKTFINGDECMVMSKSNEYYFRAYIYNSCPLVKDYDKFYGNKK